jgi:hypothetical protein
MPSLQHLRVPKLTIFGRSLLLIVLELFMNALFWVVAGILFGSNNASRPVLNLALLAWVCIILISNLYPSDPGTYSTIVDISFTDPGAEARYAPYRA